MMLLAVETVNSDWCFTIRILLVKFITKDPPQDYTNPDYHNSLLIPHSLPGLESDRGFFPQDQWENLNLSQRRCCLVSHLVTAKPINNFLITLILFLLHQIAEYMECYNLPF